MGCNATRQAGDIELMKFSQNMSSWQTFHTLEFGMMLPPCANFYSDIAQDRKRIKKEHETKQAPEIPKPSVPRGIKRLPVPERFYLKTMNRLREGVNYGYLLRVIVSSGIKQGLLRRMGAHSQKSTC